jgi:hypothetical protein
MWMSNSQVATAKIPNFFVSVGVSSLPNPTHVCFLRIKQERYIKERKFFFSQELIIKMVKKANKSSTSPDGPSQAYMPGEPFLNIPAYFGPTCILRSPLAPVH